MLDVDAAEALLQLTGKLPVKRPIMEVAEQEKNKRQKLSISDGAQISEKDKGISLKDILNSPQDSPIESLSNDVDPLITGENESKFKNRMIIRSFWAHYFPEISTINNNGLLATGDMSTIDTVNVADDKDWKNAWDRFMKFANLKQVKQLITDFLLKKIRDLFPDITQIPWKQIAEFGLFGWPEELPIENVWGMGFTKLNLLVDKMDEIELSTLFVDEMKQKNSGKSNKIQSLQKSICYHIRNTLTQQLGMFISNIPWKDLQKDDFINWPDEVPVIYPVNLSIPQKLKLNEHVDEIKLTDSALERIKGSMSSEIHVLRKEIISTLRLKLNQQLGVQVANVPWKDLKPSDIENWPESVPLEYPNLLTSTQNKQILEHLDEMKFSDEFLKKMSETITSNRYYQGKTSSHIAKDLREKLNFQMNSYVSGIPWKDITAKDIIGWPEEIPVKHPHHLTALEREKIIEKINEMNFSQDFLERLKGKKVCFDLRKLVSSGLRSKLANQLGCVVAHIPWKEMTLDDITGWPSDIPIKYPNLLTASQNKRIMDSLVNITFTTKFLDKCQLKMA